MKIAIMQPYFLPYIGYFQLINAVDKFVILDSVNFIKSGWINRNNILLNGKSHRFTINIKNESSNVLIKDVYLLDGYKGLKKLNSLRKTIDQSYKKAPYFTTVYDIIEDILSFKSETLTELILYSLKRITNYLQIDTEIIPTSTHYENGFKGQDRIIHICKEEKSEHYVNPIGGVDIYDKALFKANGICLSFLKSRDIEYKQFSFEFVPWLSIIDVCMFNSVDEIKKMLTEYDLV